MPLPVCFAVMFGTTVAWLVLLHLVLRRVERAHPDVYDSMGRPNVIMNNTPRNNGPALRFVLDRRYRTLEDPVLNRLGDLARLAFFASTTLMIVVVLLFWAAMFFGTARNAG